MTILILISNFQRVTSNPEDVGTTTQTSVTLRGYTSDSYRNYYSFISIPHLGTLRTQDLV